jgi:hypothetical protein
MTTWIAAGVFFVIALVAAGVGVRTYGWVKTATVSEGTVIELIEKERKGKKRHKGPSFAPKIAYVQDGVPREFVSSTSSRPAAYQVGDKVRVVAKPDEGQEAIASLGHLYGFPILGTLIGLAVAISLLLIANGEKVLRWLHPNLG